MPTSVGLLVSVSMMNLTSGLASCRAPASCRRLRSFLASALRPRRPSESSSVSRVSSMRACASAYVRAALDLRA